MKSLFLLKSLRLPVIPALFLLSGSLHAASTFTQTWNVSTAIPDNNDVGFSDTRIVSLTGASVIESVTIELNFTGGWNGDLFAYLVHDTGFAVLLNRPGRSLAATDGTATVGMNVVLDDSALTDIHTAIPMSGGSVTGTYQPDGRITDPLLVLDTDLRPAMLADFVGLNGNGSWTLFVADQSAGEQSTLQSWTLNITAVPEPGTPLLLVLGVMTLCWGRRRKS